VNPRVPHVDRIWADTMWLSG